MGNKALFIRKQAADYVTSRLFSDVTPPGPSRAVRLVSWEPPPHGWVKINTYEAVQDGRASAGGVIWDSDGMWLGGFMHFIGICTVPMAELWGIVTGLSLAWSLGYRRVCLETDSQVAILLLHKPIDRSHPLSSLVTLVKGFLGRDWLCQARHVFREANSVADALASFAFSFPLGLSFQIGRAHV